MYCSNCGRANLEGSTFCVQCGKPVVVSVPP
ncbi:MAG: zinc-ribbon domain-containing protein, partial [Candidatus Acidiferrales bacterium]